MAFRVLAVGDVVGDPGLQYLTQNLRRIRQEKLIDFVAVNGENANVVGIRPVQADRIIAAGADVITLGNHTWTRWELQPYLNEKPHILRPANFAPQCPGRGFSTFNTAFGPVMVINLIGKFSLDPNTDNPFLVVDSILFENEIKIVLVDFHAEATSEKLAMSYFLDGRVSALWGTHTHVQTSDARIFPNGSGYISDLGMTGAFESVLGIRPEQSVGKFLGDVPSRYDAAEGPTKLEGAIFEIDPQSGKCLNIETLRLI